MARKTLPRKRWTHRLAWAVWSIARKNKRRGSASMYFDAELWIDAETWID